MPVLKSFDFDSRTISSEGWVFESWPMESAGWMRHARSRVNNVRFRVFIYERRYVATSTIILVARAFAHFNASPALGTTKTNCRKHAEIVSVQPRRVCGKITDEPKCGQGLATGYLGLGGMPL